MKFVNFDQLKVGEFYAFKEMYQIRNKLSTNSSLKERINSFLVLENSMEKMSNFRYWYKILTDAGQIGYVDIYLNAKVYLLDKAKT